MMPGENTMRRTAICLLVAAGSIALVATGSVAGATVSYKYDDTGRLISAAWDNGATVVYTYDKAGNLLASAVPSGSPKLTAGGVVNAASYTAPLVRGEIAAIFGTNLSSGTLQ